MTNPAHPEGLAMLEKRKIEAEILKEVYETLKESHGVRVARKTIAESVRRSAIEQARSVRRVGAGRDVTESLPGRDAAVDQGRSARDRDQGTDRHELHLQRGALPLRRYLQGDGFGRDRSSLSCNRDGAFCEGYDPKLKLERTQTIMQGASHCDFHYRYEK